MLETNLKINTYMDTISIVWVSRWYETALSLLVPHQSLMCLTTGIRDKQYSYIIRYTEKAARMLVLRFQLDLHFHCLYV